MCDCFLLSIIACVNLHRFVIMRNCFIHWLAISPYRTDSCWDHQSDQIKRRRDHSFHLAKKHHKCSRQETIHVYTRRERAFTHQGKPISYFNAWIVCQPNAFYIHFTCISLWLRCAIREVIYKVLKCDWMLNYAKWCVVQNEIEQNIEDRSVPVTTRPMRDGELLHWWLFSLYLERFCLNYDLVRNWKLAVIISSSWCHGHCRGGKRSAIQLYVDGNLRISNWSRRIPPLGKPRGSILWRADAVVPSHWGQGDS